MRLNFDLLAKPSFQTTEDGTRLFYPNGLGGRGYRIDSDALYRQLFQQQIHWGLFIMIVVTGLITAHVIWQIGLTSFIVLNLFKQHAVRKLTRHMPISPIRFSIDRFFGQALRLPLMRPVILKAFMAGCVLIFLTCLGLILYQPSLWNDLLGGLLISLLLFYLGIRQRQVC